MVMGLQQLFKLIPLAGTLGKHQPVTDGMIQPLTFGEILKFKEGELQREQQVSAASIAAALAALQSQFIMLPSAIPAIATGDVKTNPSLDPSLQPAGNSAETSTSSRATPSAAARFIATETSAPVPQALANLQAGTGSQQTPPVDTSIAVTTDSAIVNFANDAANVAVYQVGPASITGYLATQAKEPTSSMGFKSAIDPTAGIKQEVAQKTQGPVAKSASQMQVPDVAMKRDIVSSSSVPALVPNSADVSVSAQSTTVSALPAEKTSAADPRQFENPAVVDGKQFSSFKQLRTDVDKVVTTLDKPEIAGNGPAVRIGTDDIRTSPETHHPQGTVRTVTKLEPEAKTSVSETVSSSMNMDPSDEAVRSSTYAATQAKTLPEQSKTGPSHSGGEENPVINTTVTESKPATIAQSTLANDIPSGAKLEAGYDLPGFEVTAPVLKADEASFAVASPQLKIEIVHDNEIVESFMQIAGAQNDNPEKNIYQSDPGIGARVSQLVTDEPEANVAWASQALPRSETSIPVSREGTVVKNETPNEVKNATTNTSTGVRFETKDSAQLQVKDNLVFESPLKINSPSERPVADHGSEPVPDDPSTSSQNLSSASNTTNLDKKLFDSRIVAEARLTEAPQQKSVTQNNSKIVDETIHSDDSPLVLTPAIDRPLEEPSTNTVRPEKPVRMATVKQVSETAAPDANVVKKPIVSEKGTVIPNASANRAVERSVTNPGVNPEVHQSRITRPTGTVHNGTTQTIAPETNRSTKTAQQGGHDEIDTVTTFKTVSAPATREPIAGDDLSPKSTNKPAVTDELVSAETKASIVAKAITSFGAKPVEMVRSLKIEAEAPEKPDESLIDQSLKAPQLGSKVPVTKALNFAYSQEYAGVGIQVPLETQQSITHTDTPELSDGEMIVEIVGSRDQTRPEIVSNEPPNIYEKVVVERTVHQSMRHMETEPVSRSVAVDRPVSAQSTVYSAVSDSGERVDLNIQSQADSFDAKVADSDLVLVEKNENLYMSEIEIEEGSQLAVDDASVSSMPEVFSNAQGARPAAIPAGTVGQEHSKESVRLNQPIKTSMPIAEVNMPKQDVAVDVKVSDHEFISGSLSERLNTSQAEAIENSQPDASDADVPVKTVSLSHATESHFPGTATAVTEPTGQEKPLSADKPANMPQQFVVESSGSKNDAGNVKVVEQNKKLNTSHIFASGEYEPVAHGSLAAQVEPKAENKTRPPMVWGEETQTADKRPELKQMPEVEMAAHGPVAEAPVAKFSGKTSEGQFQAQAVDVARQVIHEMKISIKSGLTSMHMQLNPQDLGAIDVDVVSGPRGVQVTFFAEQASTGRLLETQLNKLRDSLVDSGVQLSGLNLGHFNQQGQKGGAFSQDTKFAPFTQQNFAEHKESIKDAPIADRSIGQSSEVDYRI